MFGEISWTRLDELIECYAVLTAHQHRYLEIEHEIVEVCQNFGRSRPAMTDFSYLLNTRLQTKDETARKIAWVAQHVYRMRTWCVGQKVIFQRRHRSELSSPLISQLGRLGFKMNGAFDLRRFCEEWRGSSKRQDKLDAMLADPSSNSICLVKGVSYSQAAHLSRDLWLNGHRDNLFSSDGRFLLNAQAPTEAMGTLVFARDLILSAFPESSLRTVFVIIDDPECGWHFQAYDCSKVSHVDLVGPKVRLDDIPVDATHLQYKKLLDNDPDSFESLPSWAPFDFLNAAPVDRPTRCIMLLEELWARQSAKRDQLVVVRSTDLAERVQNQYRIEYPTDLWRHDIEDCLERGGFVRRVSSKGSAFAILPKGIARLLLIKTKFNPLLSGSPADLLEAVAQQARLWAAAPVL